VRRVFFCREHIFCRRRVVGKDCALFADGAERRSSHAPFCLLSSKGPACRACSLASALTTARLRFSPFLGWTIPQSRQSRDSSLYTREPSSAKTALCSRTAQSAAAHTLRFASSSSKGPACRACSLASALTTARLRFSPFLGGTTPPPAVRPPPPLTQGRRGAKGELLKEFIN